MTDIRATYRLQLGPDFGLHEARALVPYLRDLGVSHLYLSPVMEARAGSTHGYDVIDPTTVSPALGGMEALRELASAGLGIVLDVVPNHMAVDDDNPFWRDPLWRAKFFDLDWMTGAHRRFFDVGELAGVRVEDAEVFETTHRTVIELVRDGVVDGVRIDHPDGLADPARYLERLAEAGIDHVWVEKILQAGEPLRDWPVDGTTGYDFLNDVTALLVDPSAEGAFDELYADVTGEQRPFSEVEHAAKLEQARSTFDDEVERLRGRLPAELADLDIPAALAALPVYRTYVVPDTGLVAEEDRRVVEAAGLDPRLAAILLLDERGLDSFVVRFQQTTPPVTAKGVEDTAFYRWNRLLALNEVGGDPGRFSLSVDRFHEANLERARRFPRALLAATTHDTKRSADVRARLVALTHMPEAWREHVERWRDVTGGWRDPNEEYFLWQTLVGAWPISGERLGPYLEKALREAKTNTAWVDGDPDWEAAYVAFAQRLLSDARFLRTFEPFAARVADEGSRIALAQVLLRLTCPGVPDIYQGDEMPLHVLVDPDNRGPVSWQARREALARLAEGGPVGRGLQKIYVTQRALALRARRPASFAGGYEPIDAGPEVVAFRRGDDVAVGVALRAVGEPLRLTLPGVWEDVLPGLPPEHGLRLLERVG